MSDAEQPLVQFESGGSAAVVNYNIPLPTSYGCRRVFEFDFPAETFREPTRVKPSTTIRDNLATLPLDELSSRIRQKIRVGFQDPAMFEAAFVETSPIGPSPGDGPAVSGIGTSPSVTAPAGGGTGTVAEPTPELSETVRDIVTSPEALDAIRERLGEGGGDVRPDGGAMMTAGSAAPMPRSDDYLSVREYYKPVLELDPSTIAAQVQDGKFMYFEPTFHGDFVPGFHPEPPEPRPQLALVERYRISNFLGNYGAGKTLKTFSLFPGEQTTISVKTFRNDTRTRKEAANLFEASSREAAYEFERELETELETSSKVTDKNSWKGGGSAEVNLGIVKFGGGGGARGETTAVREHTARAVASASQKHAAKSSAKREIDINTETETTVETGEEQAVERIIENINVSRTLNFVFRQMNQQYLTLFHLVDVRVAFSNGYPGSYREAPLYELDVLLNDVVPEANRDGVRERILGELELIFDHEGTLHDDFVEEVTRGDFTYRTVDGEKTTTYEDEATGLSRTVPGVILSATTNTIRTDGVLVESLLGRGEGLDDYSRDLQSEAIRNRDLTNDLVESAVRRNDLGHQIAQSGNAENAEVFRTVFGDLEEEEAEMEEGIPADDD
jgi:hypothetical protein